MRTHRLLRMLPSAVMLVVISFVTAPVAAQDEADNKERSWTFVSIPDFLNADTTYPEPGWEAAIDYVLKSIKRRQPEFVLVPGDLVQGHWKSPEKIAKYSRMFYTAWLERMQAYNLPFYAAIGDHEIGDDPWKRKAKVKLVPRFKQAFKEHFKPPMNGPEHLKGTAYFIVHRNVLLISLDPFEKAPRKSNNGRVVRPKVSAEQVGWLRKTVETHPEADHVIVMAHPPIITPVKKRHSSGLSIVDGTSSKLWRTMTALNVDLYLCGEVHAVSAREADGLLQVAHGSIMGHAQSMNYLTVEVLPERLNLTIRRIPLKKRGNRLWQPGRRAGRPRQVVRIPRKARARGFKVIGEVTVHTGGRKPVIRNPTGVFAQGLKDR